uniref:Teneurin-3 n=1 Tax=Phallusia mammillata TaxID=59560 RepID=A0A6F9DM75_9ASCI|nr:teneurin-3 [Phallusia mammillata]
MPYDRTSDFGSNEEVNTVKCVSGDESPATKGQVKVKARLTKQKTPVDQSGSKFSNSLSTENTPTRSQRDSNPDTRSNSTDSGLASGSATKRRSMDSEGSNRIRATGSESSSPDAYTEPPGRVSHQSSRDEGTTAAASQSAAYKENSNVNFHGKGPTDEKYLSTASDRAADHEVSYIMMTSSSPSTLWDQDQTLAEEEIPQESAPQKVQPIGEPAQGGSPTRHRRRDVSSLLRHKKPHKEHPKSAKGSESTSEGDVTQQGAPLFDGSAFKRIDSNKYNSHRTAVTHKEPDCYDSDSSKLSSKTQKAVMRSSLNESGTVAASTGARPYSESSKGISSSDTHRSSVRYEPVVTDHSCTPPSPSNHPNSRRQLLGKRSTSTDSELDEIDDDIRDMDDVVPREEERPLTSRRRMSSPILDPRNSSQANQYGGRRGSSYLVKANSGNLLTPKSGSTSSPNEVRQHPGLPRMGTGAVQASVTSPNTIPAPTSQHYNQQAPSSVMTSRVTAPMAVDADHYDPVVTTTLKPTYEVDATGMWNFSRGTESDRSGFGGYTPGIPSSLPPHTTPNSSATGNSTTARFMSKRPSLAGRHHFDHNLHHHRRESRQQYTGSFKKFRSRFRTRFSWKCAAISFILISLILGVSLLAFVLGIFNSPVSVSKVGVPTKCSSNGDSIITVPSLPDGSGDVLQFKRKSSFEVNPASFSYMQIYVEEPYHIKFNCSLGSKAQIAVYGRKGLRPSHTKFNFFERIDGDALPSSRALQTSFATFAIESSRSKRSVSSSSEGRVNTGFLQFMEPGTWHLAVFNDGENVELVELKTSISEGLSQCPNSCRGKGDCIAGRCHCFVGFQGSDCSQVSCSVHCRGNGVYAHGKCVCFSGWKGVDCGTRSDQCLVPDCGGHGTCGGDGVCECEQGFKGEACEEVDCVDPGCSGHGICVKGQCRCNRGWMGTTCSLEDASCPAGCAGHGRMDTVTKQCVCDPGWGGTNCATDLASLNPPPAAAMCRPACHHDNGACVDGECRCNDGWTGDACDVRECPLKCDEHGTCMNGMCLCDLGWNGHSCTFVGCPNDCSGHGNCIRDAEGEYYCSCSSGWKGESCNVEVEMMCNDGRDNDHDTLTDCQDPDCCSQRACSHSTQCRGSLNPTHEISRVYGRNPLKATSSFYERVRFLINDNGIQRGAQSSKFNQKQVSVIRGKVLTLDGSPLVGAEVEIAHHPELGSTKTRTDGWYDILVNGGGSLTLSVHRTSFVPTTLTVFAPWNDYVIAPDVKMRTPSQPNQLVYDSTDCDASLLAQPSAVVLVSSVRSYSAAQCAERGTVIPEAQAIRQAVNLPGTETSLVYLSSRASGYTSILTISLVEGEKPANLLQIHLKIAIQGRLFEKKFEAESNLRYTYEWPRTDAYSRSVYGNVKAKVLVGYEYEACSQKVWKTLVSTVQGHPAMDLWSLDVHHTYHPEAGVVHLGNGGEMRLLEQPPMMSTVMGNGMTRHESCSGCNGPAARTQVLSPVALASDTSGSVYVGDHNFIRKIDSNGTATSLYSTRSAPAKYYMAVSPTSDGVLYFSNPNERQIYKLRRMSAPRSSRELPTNYEVVVGNGAACYPLQNDECGDNGPATSARLSAPKGLALDKNGRLYFVDGTRIRTVNPSTRTVSTFAGSLLVSGTRPIPCSGTISLDQVEFTFPTGLAISHLDDMLYVLDGDVVVRIDVTQRHASLAAGVPVHCTRAVAKNPDDRDARKVSLISPTSISVSPADGALIIAESDQKFIHRVRRVDPYSGRISTIAGVDSKCDCAVQECNCFSGDGNFARSASLHNPTAVTATPDGSVYIADQLNLRIRKVVHSLPALNSRAEYHVANPDANQLYVFNRDGRHVETRNVITGSLLYNFAYTTRGRLHVIRDVNGNRLQIDYDASGRPFQIALPNRQNLGLTVNRDGDITRIVQDSATPIAAFTYQSEDSGLILSSVYGRYASSFYIYDVYGRVITAVSPTGSMTSLHRSVNATRYTVTIETAATSAGSTKMGVGRRDVVISTEPGYLCDLITTTEGAMMTTYKRWTDNSISVHYLDDSDLILETKPHPVLGLTAPFLAKRTIRLPSDPLENEIVWRTRKEKDAGSGSHTSQFLLGRRMAVNGRNILSLDYSQALKMEKIYDDHAKFMLRVQYNDRGLPTLWMPNNVISPVNVTYDPKGHASTWQRGRHTEHITYDASGNMQSVRTPDGNTWRYTYGNLMARMIPPHSTGHFTFAYDGSSNLHKLTLPSGLTYTLDRRIGIGFVRTTFIGADGVDMLVLDNNDHGSPLAVYYPGEKRKSIFRYDAHGHMTEVLHDGTRTSMLRDPQSGEIVSVSTDRCTLRFHRNGPLVQRHTVTSSTDGGLLAVFDYTNDVNLRLDSIQVKVNGTRLPQEFYSYDDVSGKLTTFGPYKVIDFDQIYTISTDTVTLSKQSQNSGRITGVSLYMFRAPIYNLGISYDQAGRIDLLTVSGLDDNVTTVGYSYTSKGELKSCAIDGTTKWRYTYDADGKLSKIEENGVLTTLRYDKYGRLTSCGDLQYRFDKDGFLQQRGNEVFEYDSMGHLTTAYRLDDAYEIKYAYDGFGRLTTRVNVRTGEVIRFLYADLAKPDRLTHTFNATSHRITTYRYDVEGHLFAMERSDGQVWSIVCDHMGSPIGVFNSGMKMVKRIKYSPFGQVLHDSEPSLFVAIGFRGGIYDVTTGLVRFANREALSPLSAPKITPDSVLGQSSSREKSTGQLQQAVEYDAIVGQLTSSGVYRLKDLGTELVVFTAFQVVDPVNPVPVFNHMTDTSSWLTALGFKLQNVAPDPQIASRQKDKSSVECQLSQHLRAYMSLQTVTPSVLVPTRQMQNEKDVIPDGTLFAQGLVLIVDRGSIATQVLNSATDDVKRLSGIIKGADVIFGKDADSASAAMSLTLEGKPNVFLAKSPDSFEKDKQTLRLVSGHDRILDGGNPQRRGSTAATPGGSDAPIVVSTNQKQIRVETGYAVITILYVNSGTSSRHSDYSSEEVERDRVASEALRRAEVDAWSREKAKIKQGLKTMWNERQRQEILSRGSLSTWTVEFAFDADLYPELADSGRNVKFVRRRRT